MKFGAINEAGVHIANTDKLRILRHLSKLVVQFVATLEILTKITLWYNKVVVKKNRKVVKFVAN